MTESLHPYEGLTPDVVMDAVESVGYRCDARNLVLNSYENRVFQIGLEEAEPLIGKFYRPGRWTDDQILEEHEFTRELFELEIPVVPPILLNNESTLAEYKGYRFSLYRRYGGRAPELDDEQSLTILGRFVGRIHAAGSAGVFSHRPSISVESYATSSRNYLLSNNYIPAELIPAYETITKELIAVMSGLFEQCQSVRIIRLHGDCHMGNVLWRDSVPHFVDFDDARNGPAIQDLWMMLSGSREHQSVQIRKILEGYTDFCDFNPLELRLVEACRTLRIMHHCCWIARRWDDPAFPRAFPWFNSQRYWSNHILELREQLSALVEMPLELY
jgi:Ser/Thr protein kinase RdoA (MazF antagonist)